MHGVITAAFASLSFALIAGIVMYALGDPVRQAVGVGGGAFIVLMMLALAIMTFLRR
ncbi:hypothetical protein [Streptomyces sp. NPDC046261]|uniref:hypothetical protein n=1 Tax=Streptomyces sp. NPDC046261 TaxID=3157200 RepID=UPI0033EB726C